MKSIATASQNPVWVRTLHPIASESPKLAGFEKEENAQIDWKHGKGYGVLGSMALCISGITPLTQTGYDLVHTAHRRYSTSVYMELCTNRSINVMGPLNHTSCHLTYLHPCLDSITVPLFLKRGMAMLSILVHCKSSAKSLEGNTNAHSRFLTQFLTIVVILLFLM